jgi:DNA-binding MarR family transcriptional regulator
MSQSEADAKTDTETDPQIVVEELDWKSQEILRALLENGGSANTTELRALTGIDNNDPINYRHNNKLVPRGLVELTQPDAGPNQLVAQVATLTPHGEAVAESVIEQRGEETNIGDAVEQFNARLTRVESQIDRLDADSDVDPAALNELQEQVDDLDGKLEALYRNMERFRNYLNERDDGGYSEHVQQQEQDGE